LTWKNLDSHAFCPWVVAVPSISFSVQCNCFEKAFILHFDCIMPWNIYIVSCLCMFNSLDYIHGQKICNYHIKPAYIPFSLEISALWFHLVGGYVVVGIAKYLLECQQFFNFCVCWLPSIEIYLQWVIAKFTVPERQKPPFGQLM
jgi:hypothetical protein